VRTSAFLHAARRRSGNPWPGASGYYFLETFSGANDALKNVGGAAGMPWFDNPGLWAVSLEADNPSLCFGISYSRVPTDYGFGGKIVAAGKTAAQIQAQFNSTGASYGQQGHFYTASLGNAYAGLTPATVADTFGADMETWYRVRQMWPSSDHHWMPGLLPLADSFAWHDQQIDLDNLTPADGGPGSPRIRTNGTGTAWGGETVGGGYTMPYVTYEGTVPALTELLIGGPTTNYDVATVDTTLRVGTAFGNNAANRTNSIIKTPSGVANPLSLDTWYDIVCRRRWSAGTTLNAASSWTNGLSQVWVNGTLVVDVDHPTVWWRTTNVHGFFGLGVYCYHCWASYSRSVVYDAIVWGPSAASIGFTP